MLDFFLQPDPYGLLLLFWSWLWSWLRRFPGGGKLTQLLSLDGAGLVCIGVKYCRRTRNPPLLDLPLVCVKSWSSGGSEMMTGSRDCWREGGLALPEVEPQSPHLPGFVPPGSLTSPDHQPVDRLELWTSPCSKFSICISTNQRPAWYHPLDLTT